MSNYQAEAGKLLQALRVERSLLVDDLAFEAGTLPETLSDLELGASRPSLDTLDKILKALGRIQPVDKGKRQELLVLYSRTGGERLRQLREAGEKMSQESLALEAGISTRALSDIERGITYQPSKDILQHLLAALDKKGYVSFQDRQTVFASYGYRAPIPLPTTEEMEMARKQWSNGYTAAPYPAYLLSCTMEVLDWNRFAPRLLGLSTEAPEMASFSGVTIYDVMFSLASDYLQFSNREAYFSSVLRTMKTQDLMFSHEEWYERFIEREKAKYPEFARIWDEIDERELQPTVLGSAITPIEIEIAGIGRLRFQLMPVRFSADPRFMVVQWMPIDQKTMLQCTMWVNEEEARETQ